MLPPDIRDIVNRMGPGEFESMAAATMNATSFGEMSQPSHAKIIKEAFLEPGPSAADMIMRGALYEDQIGPAVRILVRELWLHSRAGGAVPKGLEEGPWDVLLGFKDKSEMYFGGGLWVGKKPKCEETQKPGKDDKKQPDGAKPGEKGKPDGKAKAGDSPDGAKKEGDKTTGAEKKAEPKQADDVKPKAADKSTKAAGVEKKGNNRGADKEKKGPGEADPGKVGEPSEPDEPKGP